MNNATPRPPVLILGAGINGCAVARELVLNGVPVFVVDSSDIAFGATAKSSRLIHGGVRYLEYGDVGLVAESLQERERLLKLAPQFVRPLKLHIPVTRRWGGMLQSAARFLRLSRFPLGRRLTSILPVHGERSLSVVRTGLWLYDWIARSSLLPRSEVHAVSEPGVPSVDPEKFRWVCSYYDSQMVYPERFVIALLQDAERAARKSGVEFHVLPYHRAVFDKQTVSIRPVDDDSITHTLAPSTIINATGAWGDFTLEQLGIAAERLLGGTKGSHFITSHPGLKQALADGGIYAEAADGRLVFILPFVDSVLVGTTDERFNERPECAVATEEELDYLVGMVNEVFPHVGLTRADIDLHYSGVRPLPYVPSGRTGSIPRGHWIHSSDKEGIPVETLIGGKLTTCRAFAEEVANRLFDRLQVTRTVNTRDRLIPGAEGYPHDVAKWCEDVAASTGYSPSQVQAVFQLTGTRAREILSEAMDGPSESVPQTNLPVAFVDWVIEREWVHTLGDLVERRLGLVFAPRLSPATLETLADRLCSFGRLDNESREQAIAEVMKTLQERYGIAWASTAETKT